MRGTLVLALLVLPACGDDTQPMPDAAMPDAAIDAPMPDAAPPDGSPFLSTGDNQILESETHVASDGSGNLVAAWIGISANNSTNGYAISHDRGLTWSHATHLDA